MKYHAPTGQFTVPRESLEAFSALMRYAIRKVREQAGLPLEGGKVLSFDRPAPHAEQAILDGCERLGVDLGASRPGILDVRDAG